MKNKIECTIEYGKHIELNAEYNMHKEWNTGRLYMRSRTKHKKKIRNDLE